LQQQQTLNPISEQKELEILQETNLDEWVFRFIVQNGNSSCSSRFHKLDVW
jgi:hypothetical protein